MCSTHPIQHHTNSKASKKMKCKLVFVFLLMGTLSCEEKNNSQHDYFRLILRWPNSYCLTLTTLSTCRRQVPQYFTIGGFWPELFCSKQPVMNCATQQQLTDDIIERHKLELLKHWPDLTTYDNEYQRQIWKDQWQIYGSCASDILSPEDYIVSTMSLRESHNLYEILASSDIRANGSSYPAINIQHAIFKATRSTVDILCKKDRLGNVYLAEIHQCIDNDAKEFIDCEDLALNCGDDPIYFPDKTFIPGNRKAPDRPYCPKIPPSYPPRLEPVATELHP